MIDISPIREDLLRAQKNEITEYLIYNKLSTRQKDRRNRVTLQKISSEEYQHYEFWREYTGVELKPRRFKIWFYLLIARVFGLTFGVKLMELGEETAQINYQKIQAYIPPAKKIIEDEDSHEKALINIIEEERLSYVGSIVLGLNDALVELTGTLAGLSFALQNNRLIAVVGLITGIAAALSMAASEYLSKKSEGKHSRALRSSLYTGVAYIGTVFLLVIPFFLLPMYQIALPVTLGVGLLIILIFNFYISVAKDYNFLHRFGEMAAISLGVAFVSFMIGFVIRSVFGVDV
ncbi:MAG: VIT1/CCC1 transporter family protein [Spirochaetaceae bacterium]|nr:VIT1/CCC1 transporter family protein [Spirochaetaceae bacterium]